MKLAILLYNQFGTLEEMVKIKAIEAKLQKQLNEVDSDQVECVFYYDAGEKNVEEKKIWLQEQTKANKYVFINGESEIEDNFIVSRFVAVKGRKSTLKLIELGVFSKKAE